MSNLILLFQLNEWIKITYERAGMVFFLYNSRNKRFSPQRRKEHGEEKKRKGNMGIIGDVEIKTGNAPEAREKPSPIPPYPSYSPYLFFVSLWFIRQELPAPLRLQLGRGRL